MKLITHFMFFVFIMGTTACTFTLPDSSQAEKVNVIPFGSVEPDLDYSNQSPDCLTAAQRIKDYVVEGMTLADVRRLVGQPRVVLPGSWWWTAGIGKEGKPSVRYAFGPADDDVPVTSTVTDTSGC